MKYKISHTLDVKSGETLWSCQEDGPGYASPVVSTLNAVDGAIASNAAIVPAGTGGLIKVSPQTGDTCSSTSTGIFCRSAIRPVPPYYRQEENRNASARSDVQAPSWGVTGNAVHQ